MVVGSRSFLLPVISGLGQLMFRGVARRLSVDCGVRAEISNPKPSLGGKGPVIFAERRLVSGFQNDKYLKLAANQRARSRVSRPAAHAFLVRALQELWQIGALNEN